MAGREFFFPHGFAGQLDQFGVVDEAVENGDGEGRVVELAVPEFDRQLAGDQHTAALLAIFQQFELLPFFYDAM